MFKFGDPQWLRFAWGAVALFIMAIWWWGRSFTKFKKAFGRKTDLLISSLSIQKVRWHYFLQCAALACFALALARPLLGSRLSEVKQTGIELLIAVDVSNSMLAEDDKPSRLEHAKHEILRLLDLVGGDRIGLIAFAGNAILVSPMTSDTSAIKMYVSSLSPDSVSTQGTNFKYVMDEAIRAFEKGGVEGLNGTKPTRALIIASDGEDNEPGGMAEVKKASDAGIRIFTLGFGSERGAPIPLRDDRGSLKGYKKDLAGQVVLSVPSDQGLAKLARAGGGAYYHSTFEESELKNLLADLNHLEKADFKSRLSTDFDERFQIPLLLGLILAFLDLMFGDRKSGTKPWRGRFQGVPSIAAFVALFGLLILSPRPARAFGPPSVNANDRGIEHFEKEEYSEAFQNFADALGRDSMNPNYHFNLGDAFSKGGEYPKAFAEYEVVESDPKTPAELKYRAMFNAGNTAVEAKDIPRALEYYQKALGYKPDSIETKTNIELALKEEEKNGGGGGDKNQKQQQGDGQNKDDKQQPQPQPQPQPQNGPPQPTPRPKPQGFKSQALNENDVQRILDELKRQEEEIRARQYKENKNNHDQPVEKDW